MLELPLKIEAIVFRKNRSTIEYLLVKRTETDGGFWQPITGTVHDGEKLIECLSRELGEETGITKTKSISDIIYQFDWRKNSGQAICEFAYAVEVSVDSVIKLNPNEHDAYKWEKYEDAKNTLFTDNNKNAIDKVNDYLTSK